MAALLCSLRETCRLAGVASRSHLMEAARRAPRSRESVFLPEDFARMLAEQTPAGQDGDD